MRRIDGELNDIRTIISDGYDVLARANNDRAAAISHIIDRLDRIQEKLEPTFDRVFPESVEFLNEVETSLRSRRPR